MHGHSMQRSLSPLKAAAVFCFELKVPWPLPFHRVVELKKCTPLYWQTIHFCSDGAGYCLGLPYQWNQAQCESLPCLKLKQVQQDHT